MEESRFQDTPIVRLLRLLADLMGVQLLFLLCCVPVITIGPALSAMYAVLFKRERDGGMVSVIPTFFQAIRKNFLSALALGGIVLLAGVVVFGDFWFAVHSQPPISSLYMVLTTVVGILTLIVFVLAFAQQSVFSNSIFGYVKNSFKLVLCAPWQLVVCLAAWIIPWFVGCADVDLLSYVGFFLFLWGFSFPVWVTVKLYWKVFQKAGTAPEK